MAADETPQAQPSPTVLAAARPPSFLGELRDAVTPRAALMMIGVFLLQCGFIASYLGAFHAPTPRQVTVSVAPGAGVPTSAVDQTVQQLNALSGRPLDARAVAGPDAARADIENRDAYGALVLGADGTDQLLVASAAGASVSTALETVFDAVESQQSRTLTVLDVKPAEQGDARGLSGFYLVVGWVVGGYLAAAILGLSGGSRPATRRRAVIRLAALAVYAVVSGVAGALISEFVLSALSGHFLALLAFGALIVFAVGAFTAALQVLLGVVGIGVAIALFVVLGNPSAGGAYSTPMLPPFWAAIGPWLPPGAGTEGVRSIVYFGGSGLAPAPWVLTGYAVAGVLVTVAAARRRPGAAPEVSAPGARRPRH